MNLSHSTYFMIDHTRSFSIKKTFLMGTFQDFVEREPGYDTAFHQAFKYSLVNRNINYDTPEKLFELFTSIHRFAVTHLKKDAQESCGYSFKSQNFVILKGPACNSYGLKALIEKIWKHKASFELRLRLGSDRMIILNSTNCYEVERYKVEDTIQEAIKPVYEHPEEVSLEEISEEWLKVFEKKKPFFLTNGTKREKREILVLESAKKYLLTLASKGLLGEEAVMQAIAVFMQDLMQLHYFNDGNARTCYLLANLLMLQNGLAPFYPDNMCLFDANSISKMVRQMSKGVHTFAEKFGSIEQLESSLDEYYQTVENLKILLGELAPSNGANLIERGRFEHLLRKMAAKNDSKSLEILTFLISNAPILNIDLFAKGDRSGKTALEIAKYFSNEKAVALLSSCILEKREVLNELLSKHGILDAVKEFSHQEIFSKSIQEINLNEIFVFLLTNRSFLDLDLELGFKTAKSAENETAAALIKDIRLAHFSEKTLKLLKQLKGEEDFKNLIYQGEFDAFSESLQETIDDLFEQDEETGEREYLLEKASNILTNNSSLFRIAL